MPRRKALSRCMREACECGTKLKHYQAWYCSCACRDRYAAKNGAEPNNIEKVPEPRTAAEILEFNRLIKQRQSELQTTEKQLIKQQSPEDDSPEAEIRLRQLLCPNPVFYNQNGGYVRKR